MILKDNFTVHTTKQFKEELKDIIFHIKFKLKEPLIADNFYKATIEGISSLSFMPERHSKIYNLQTKYQNLRKFSLKQYVVIYTVNKNTRTSIRSAHIPLQSKLFKSTIIHLAFSH